MYSFFKKKKKEKKKERERKKSIFFPVLGNWVTVTSHRNFSTKWFLYLKRHKRERKAKMDSVFKSSVRMYFARPTFVFNLYVFSCGGFLMSVLHWPVCILTNVESWTLQQISYLWYRAHGPRASVGNPFPGFGAHCKWNPRWITFAYFCQVTRKFS